MRDCTKISVAVCTYNGEKYIEEQIASIFRQTRKVDEIVVGDDGSADGTVEAVRRAFSAGGFSGDPEPAGAAEEPAREDPVPTEPVFAQAAAPEQAEETGITPDGVTCRIIRNEKNLGYRKNFENVIRNTTGDVIFLCDQDDVWLEDKVEKMMAVMEQDPSCLMAFSDAFVTDADLQVQKGSQWDAACYTRNRTRFPDMMDLLLSGYYVTGAAACIRRDLFDRCSDFSSVWVHDGWLAVHAALYGALTPVPDKLLYYRQHGDNQIGARADSSLLAWAGNKLEVLRGGARKQLALHRDSRDRWKELYDLHREELSADRRQQIRRAVRVHAGLYRLPGLPVPERLRLIRRCWKDGSYMAFYRRGRSCMLADLLFLAGGRPLSGISVLVEKHRKKAVEEKIE